MNCNPVKDDILSNLNQEQINAVTASMENHLLVLAGAGCGKTTVLTRRIAFLKNNGISPKSILALTFTRKAAEEMASRVGKIQNSLHSERSSLITTFHGFALRVLSEVFEGEKNFSRIGFQGNPKLISGDDRLRLLSQISKSEDRRDLGIDLLHLDALISKYEVFPEKIENSNQVGSYAYTMSEKLTNKKQNEGLWDFSDLLCGCLRLFSNYSDIASYYAQNFKAILVDEFQDTNPIQIQLLKKILSNVTKVFAVGDDDQAIYGFRGADIRPTLEFTKYFQGAHILKLQINYRSIPAILKCANRIFSEKDVQYRKNLVSGKFADVKGGDPISISFDNQKSMLKWIAVMAEKITIKEKIPVQKIALLFRINQSLLWTYQYIMANYPNISQMTFLTVHKSKGLEFPIVFLCDLEESVFPSYRIPHNKPVYSLMDLLAIIFKKRKTIDCNWDEEKRLFYVGVTRAEKSLYLLSVKNKTMYGRIRKFSRSRFCRYA